MVETSKAHDKLMRFVIDASPSSIFIDIYQQISINSLDFFGHLEYRENCLIPMKSLNWLRNRPSKCCTKELCSTRWVVCDKATIQKTLWELLKLDWKRVTWWYQSSEVLGGWWCWWWCFCWCLFWTWFFRGLNVFLYTWTRFQPGTEHLQQRQLLLLEQS